MVTGYCESEPHTGTGSPGPRCGIYGSGYTGQFPPIACPATAVTAWLERCGIEFGDGAATESMTSSETLSVAYHVATAVRTQVPVATQP